MGKLGSLFPMLQRWPRYDRGFTGPTTTGTESMCGIYATHMFSSSNKRGAHATEQHEANQFFEHSETQSRDLARGNEPYLSLEKFTSPGKGEHLLSQLLKPPPTGTSQPFAVGSGQGIGFIKSLL